MAGVDVNRTHRGRDTPPIGFEDRERHQATDYSPTHFVSSVYQLELAGSSFFSAICSGLDDPLSLLHRFNGFQHVGYLTNLQFVL